MNEKKKVFHLAIPTTSIEESIEFYVESLGCRLARNNEEYAIIDFFGDQLVCHLSEKEEIIQNPKMYPRHFGVIYTDKSDYESLYKLAQEKEIKFFKENFVRFEGGPAEHSSFFLQDPSNNLLEFKYYKNPQMIY